MIRKIVSGAQTGADRAALDVARNWPIESGGWVPKGRLAEDGIVPADYPGLRETDSAEVAVRTEANVHDSDGTLILSHGPLRGGSLTTLEVAHRLSKPVLHVDLAVVPFHQAIDSICGWLKKEHVVVLNVAGPRASEDPRVASATTAVLAGVLTRQSDEDLHSDADCDIAVTLFENTAENFRHWDTVRWAVPSWFMTIAAAIFTVTQVLGRPENAADIKHVALGLAVFGILCCLLQLNLVRYHSQAIERLDESLAQLRIRSSVRKALELKLPFSFKDAGVMRTASFWLLLASIGVTIALLVVAVRGPWWM
jgi:hypothetical protein